MSTKTIIKEKTGDKPKPSTGGEHKKRGRPPKNGRKAGRRIIVKLSALGREKVDELIDLMHAQSVANLIRTSINTYLYLNDAIVVNGHALIVRHVDSGALSKYNVFEDLDDTDSPLANTEGKRGRPTKTDNQAIFNNELQLNFSEEAMSALTQLKEAVDGTTTTKTIRDALRLMERIIDCEKDGNRLLIRDKDTGEVERIPSYLVKKQD